MNDLMNKNDFVDKISALCSLNRRFHCQKRERELKSLTKYMKEFTDFSAYDFTKFVCKYYISSLRQCRRFCSQSIYNRVCAIQGRLNISVMSRARYNNVLKNLRKLFNPYSTDTSFYSSTGNCIDIQPDEITLLRKNNENLIKQNSQGLSDRWNINTYTDTEVEVVYNYFRLHLVNFLQQNTKSGSGSGAAVGSPINENYIFRELCVLVVFCYNTPRRISELINLTLNQMDELITSNTLNIKSKDGFTVDCIYISVALADILNRYMEMVKPVGPRVFSSTYKMYYSRMKKIVQSLIGEERVKNLRIFHGFRNYYAGKHINNSDNECQRILGHKTVNMTRKYASGQKQDVRIRQQAKVLEYINRQHTTLNQIPL